MPAPARQGRSRRRVPRHPSRRGRRMAGCRAVRRFCYLYRMLRSRYFALLAVIAALAFPAASLAQSAGDDQYQDPLAGQPSGGGNSGGSGNSGNTGSTGSTGSNTAPAATTPTPTSGGSEGTAPQASAAATSGGELPRTGFDVVLTIEIGLALLLTGIVTQRSLVLRDRREQRH